MNWKQKYLELHGIVRGVMDKHVCDVHSGTKVGKISLEGFLILVKAVDEDVPQQADASDPATACDEFDFSHSKKCECFICRRRNNPPGG